VNVSQLKLRSEKFDDAAAADDDRKKETNRRRKGKGREH
jgi:hypothetical protein